jgi:hypothetical protein
MSGTPVAESRGDAPSFGARVASWLANPWAQARFLWVVAIA